ncbi:hypothetical protein QL992_03785 [Microbacterium sp. APC 3898]|jgi:ABC-type multidrug transport system permease subunit|uniref:Uncharacterized protein n=2 Tax=Planococcus TaxID=1372 RepID=A0ABT7ZLV3_9BACL|nr:MULTISPECIES: hypothetical protein [Terrabacteria group]MBD8015256.1 hypothetical protein [Planococcus wigleyi]MDN3428145.1 hypothetical protein [Planococcus sp. APC 4016]MDN3439540.1 hypothetical protein [Planococcus sp. APC 3900]MDN3498320.1 hypothetical protein [Microbacterium sp. APC 3898]
MKGFLSLLGITLIVGAFGLILLSFYGNPLEKAISQERMYAYIETRQNDFPEVPERNQVTAEIPAQAAFTTTAFMAMDNSCERASLE